MHILCHSHETWPDDNIVPVSAVVVIGISAAKSSRSMVGFNLEKCTFGGTCPRSKLTMHRRISTWHACGVLYLSILLYTKQPENPPKIHKLYQQKHPPPAWYETASMPIKKETSSYTPLALQSNQLKLRWRSANMDLTKPATPAAPSKCPMLVFTSRWGRFCESMNWYELRKMTPEIISNSWS